MMIHALTQISRSPRIWYFTAPPAAECKARSSTALEPDQWLHYHVLCMLWEEHPCLFEPLLLSSAETSHQHCMSACITIRTSFEFTATSSAKLHEGEPKALILKCWRLIRGFCSSISIPFSWCPSKQVVLPSYIVYLEGQTGL